MFRRLAVSAIFVLLSTQTILAVDPCTFLVGPVNLTTQSFMLGSMTNAIECILQVPYSPTIAKQTLNVLNLTTNLYQFEDIAANPPAPYLPLDLRAELRRISSTTYPSDVAFHNDVTRAFQGLYDAHTMYYAPNQYNGYVVRPFNLGVQLNSTTNQLEVYVINTDVMVFGANFSTISAFVNVPIPADPSVYYGLKVTKINGIDALTYVEQFAGYQGLYKEPSARLNSALKGNYAIQMFLQIPLSVLTNGYLTETYTFANGATVTYQTIAILQGIFDSLSALKLSLYPVTRSTDADQELPWSLLHSPRVSPQLFRPEFFSVPNSGIMNSRAKRLIPLSINPITLPYPTIGLSAAALSTSTSNAVWLGITTFDGNNLTTYLQSFFENMVVVANYSQTTKTTNLIIDVTGNGGGYIAIAVALAQSLIGRSTYDMSLQGLRTEQRFPMDTFISYTYPFSLLENFNQDCNTTTYDPYTARTVVENTRGGYTSRYTPIFESTISHNQSAALPDISSLFKKIIILSDGTCGSACNMFSTLMQDSGAAYIITYGGVNDPSMDFAAFGGGSVFDYTSTYAEFIKSQHSSLPAFPSPTANTRFTALSFYAPSDSIVREYSRHTGNQYIQYWPNLNSGSGDPSADASLLFQVVDSLPKLPFRSSSATCRMIQPIGFLDLICNPYNSALSCGPYPPAPTSAPTQAGTTSPNGSTAVVPMMLFVISMTLFAFFSF